MTKQPAPLDSRRFELIHEAGERFDNILSAIEHACERYAAEQPHAWAMETRSPDTEWIRRTLLDMWHERDLPGNFTSRHAGVIAASAELRQAFRAINDAKADFQVVIDQMKQTKPAYNSRTQLKELLAHRHPALREHLNTAGMARLSLKKTWRRLFVFDEPVRHLGIGWYVSGRSIVKISIEEAEKKLLRLGADQDHVDIQLKQLASLPPGEPLALVRNQAPLLRCNVQFEESEDGETPKSVGLNSSMPVVVPPDAYTGLLPPLRTPPSSPPPAKAQRQRRKDTKIEEQPFLPSISVHRYLSRASDEGVSSAS